MRRKEGLSGKVCLCPFNIQQACKPSTQKCQSLYVPQWELWCLDTFFLSLSLPASPWPAASCCQCYCGQCHLWWAARNSCQWQTHSYLKQPEPQLMNWKMVLITYTVPASNCFLRLGSGGSGIPYFSRLSAARSRYFIYIENKKKQGRSILTSAFFFFNSLIHADVNLKHPLIWSICSLTDQIPLFSLNCLFTVLKMKTELPISS